MTVAFTTGHVAIGGRHEYVEVIDHLGAQVMLIQQFDDIERPMKNVMGATFNAKERDLYTALTPDEAMRHTPHDICWLPDNSGLLVAVVLDIGELELRKYDFDGNMLYGPDGSLGPAWTNLATDFGWAQEAVKIDVTCDSQTLFYTDSMRTVFRYDLATSTQLPNYKRLAAGSGYIYGGVRVLPVRLAASTHSGGLEIGPVCVVAMTLTGDGPRRALAIGADQSIWTDEVNPAGPYHVFKRKLRTGAEVLSVVTVADDVPRNDRTLALACCFNKCGGAPMIFGQTVT